MERNSILRQELSPICIIRMASKGSFMRRRLGWMHIGYVAIANACWLVESTPVPDSRTNRHGHLKGMRFPIDVILFCIRCYAAYPLSYRHLEEMMQERGMLVDNLSINRWAIRFLRLSRKWPGNTSARWTADGEWARHTSRSRASGNSSTAQSSSRTTRSTSC